MPYYAYDERWNDCDEKYASLRRLAKMRKMDGGADLGYESRKDRSLMEKILDELAVSCIRQM